MQRSMTISYNLERDIAPVAGIVRVLLVRPRNRDRRARGKPIAIIAANRRNAQKSTGPVTQQGRDRSRCNAVRHELTAETVINALEDAEDYKAFEAAVIADYDAQSTRGAGIGSAASKSPVAAAARAREEERRWDRLSSRNWVRFAKLTGQRSGTR